jgi:HEAT repeat protein
VTVGEWRAVGLGAAPVLEAVAMDPQALPTRRARALAALGVVRPTRAGRLARQLASDLTGPVPLRSAAVEAMASLLGPEATGALEPLLRDREPVVRMRSAEALAASGAAGCRVVMAEARTHPPSDPVSRTAARCEAQLRSSPGSDR